MAQKNSRVASMESQIQSWSIRFDVSDFACPKLTTSNYMMQSSRSQIGRVSGETDQLTIAISH